MAYTLLLLIGLVWAQVSAHPTSSGRLFGRAAVNLDQYRSTLTSSFTLNDDIPQNVMALTSGNDIDTATSVVKQLFPGATFRLVDDHHTSNIGITHVNFKQTANGHDIDNADFHVNVGSLVSDHRDYSSSPVQINSATHRVMSYGHTFFSGSMPATDIVSVPLLSVPLVALSAVTSKLGLPLNVENALPEGSAGSFTFNNVGGVISAPKADLVWMQSPGSNQLVPSWRIETNLGADWLTSYVNAVDTSKLLSVSNWAFNDNYLVYQYPITNPTLGQRTFVNNPQDTRDYPNGQNGWQNDGVRTYVNTIGNNVIASNNPTGDINYYTVAKNRPVATGGVFSEYYNSGDYNYTDYANASTIQLFYTNNKLHDLLYLLGFDEVSGNFQYNNYNRGGLAKDNVVSYTQDGDGFNNAFMATPPDGQSPTMRMYMFTKSEPYRDSSFDLDIVVHEYMHGLSGRLTGGPSNSNCLTTTEAGGLGEGWSDFYAYAARLGSTDTPQTNVPNADWTYNNPAGARRYLYSLDTQTNPYMYASLNNLNGVHDFGTVWATILYGVYWALIAEYGNTPNGAVPTFPSGSSFPTGGKYAAWKLVLDGMKIQPCNPTFLQARNAIIQADQQATNGNNYCRLWQAFSERGLGTGAVVNRNGKYVNSYDVPVSCGASKL